MVTEKTTVKKAYIAMHDFLYDNYYKDYPEGEAKDTMIFMIGDMDFAADGFSYDPMCWDEWKIICDGNGNKEISYEVAYYAMLVFLYFFIEPWPNGEEKQAIVDAIVSLRRNKKENEKKYFSYLNKEINNKS